MKVLGIDSALGACSVAIWDKTVISREQKIMSRGHVETLVPMIQDVIRSAGLDFDQLDLIAVSIGPGSFTGLRAGLAAARGFGLALNIPVHGVTTLEAVATSAVRSHSIKPTEGILVALETKRSDIYVQMFDNQGLALREPTTILPKAVSDLVVGDTHICGDAADRILAALTGDQKKKINLLADVERPDAGEIAEIAANRVVNPVAAEPLYIHPPAAKIPEAAGRLRP